MTFEELVDRHIGLSFRKQRALGDFLGRHNWRLDMGRGTVDFGKTRGLFGKARVYPIQILGTEAEESGSWLWAWANAESNIPPALLASVGRVRSLGESDGIDALVTPKLPSWEYPGHLLASVASGIADADCYYRGPYPGGAVYFLIFETPLRHSPPTPAPRMANVLGEVIVAFQVNHRSMARAYFLSEGLRIVETESALSAADDAGRSLEITFDDMGRLSKISATAGPRQ